MKKLWLLALTGFLAACNNDGTTSDNNDNDSVASDSSLRPRPVTEAITNDTKIVNDSVIVPDTNNTGVNPSDGVDTIGPIKKKQNSQNNRNNNGQ
jgi:hypothetical protein